MDLDKRLLRRMVSCYNNVSVFYNIVLTLIVLLSSVSSLFTALQCLWIIGCLFLLWSVRCDFYAKVFVLHHHQLSWACYCVKRFNLCDASLVAVTSIPRTFWDQQVHRHAKNVSIATFGRYRTKDGFFKTY